MPRLTVLSVLAAFAALAADAAMSQSVPNAAPWDQPFLPPAPEWDGASRALLRDAGDPWVTAFEADPAHDFSPNYVDTRAWFDRLDQASDLIRIEQFGVSPEGRPMKALAVSRSGALTPEAARAAGLPVVLIQGGIHAGEIDGKDAGFLALRQVLDGDAAPGALDHLVWVFVPVFSVDGHERFGA